MSEMRVERRLSAILAADVAGYSRLMGADEEGTARTLLGHRRSVIHDRMPVFLTQEQFEPWLTEGSGFASGEPSGP
jgi:hypothetical protein